MIREKIPSHKLSINLSGENWELINEIVSNCVGKYGPTINEIISTFCRMPEGAKSVIEKACFTEIKRLNDWIARTDRNDEFFVKRYEDERDYYIKVLRLINHGVCDLE